MRLQRLPGGPTCLPEFVSDTAEEAGCVIDLKDVRHPCLTDRTSASVVVPNDVTLGFGNSRAMLITGPNMGGKSTLMRSTCLAGMGGVHTRLLGRNISLKRFCSHSCAHGRVCSVQLSEVPHSTFSCLQCLFYAAAGYLLSIESSLALEPATRSCWAKAHSWWKCWRPRRFCAMPPTGRCFCLSLKLLF